MNAATRRRAILLYAAYNVVALIVLFPVIRAGFGQIDLHGLVEVWSEVARHIGRIAHHAVRLAGELL